MFSSTVGRQVSIDGRDFLEVAKGDTGHVVYGPYEHVRPGSFVAEYDLALIGSVAGDPICAILDVASSRGAAIMVSREVRASELTAQLRRFSVEFDLHEFRALEYRIYATGAAELLIAQPYATRLGEVRAPLPPADPNMATSDPVELHRQVRAVLRLLRPYCAKGVAKVRMGHTGDGGYVSLDDFAELDTALSLGINDDISWDSETADRGLLIQQFDHTVSDPAPSDRRMVFHKKMIAAASGPGSVSLGDLIRLHDKRGARPNLLLKMDIEGAEWDVFEATPVDDLGRFSQILCELHYLQGLSDVAYRRRIYSSLQKLHRNYAVTHVHANICGGISNIGNVIFPNVLEVSFANRAIYEFEETNELFPTALDTSCDVFEPDMFLGSFRF